MRKFVPLALLLAICLNSPLSAQWHSQHQYRQWKRQPAPTPTPTPIPTPAPSASVADQIAADMAGLNEGHPHGVPLSWDFANGPSEQMMNNPAGNRAAVLWGAIYVDSAGSSATNTRVNIRACQIWWKRNSTASWILGDLSSQPQVDLYAEDFSSGGGPANTRVEPDGTLSTVTTAGHVAHFYTPYPRVGFDPNDLGGWVSVCEMRLILANPSGVDDRASAHFLASVGADYYPSTTGAGIENNPAIAGGKFKYVQSAWRSFAMTTLSKTQLESNPPLVDLSGVLP